MSTLPLRSLAAALLLAPLCGAQLTAQPDPVSEPVLVTATTNTTSSGALVALVDGRAPVPDVLAATDGARHLRRFGQQLFAVSRGAGTILRAPMNGGPSQLYTLGPDAQPMDALVPGAPAKVGHAWVTRRADPMLMRLDLASGIGTDVIDLSPVGGGAPILLGTMERHGSRLFVQVRVSDDSDVPGGDTGVLAVVDLASEQLVDVDLRAPGVQGIALKGAPPRFKMQIVGDTLYVSTTESTNDVRGGIEMVDLSSLTSVGYAISEAEGHSDMGGFVMLDATRGYYVFHTDLLASTHLVSFSVADGPAGGGMIDLLGDTVDVLVHDPWRRRIYLPSGLSVNEPGLYVFSTETDTQLGKPLATGLRSRDALLVSTSAVFEPPP